MAESSGKSGTERKERIVAALSASDLDGIVCTLPENVLLLSGYWPVVGTAVGVATRDGRVGVLSPDDERDLAETGWASEVRTYGPGSLTRLTSPVEAVIEPLAALLEDLNLARARLAFEDTSIYEESSYSAMYRFEVSVPSVLERAAPGATLLSAAPALTRLRAALTSDEVAKVRLACEIAGEAFVAGARELRPGRREPEIAAAFAAPMSIDGLGQPGVERAGAFTWCMSGPNSAQAGAAYARTRNRTLRPGDLVLVHCNSYLDGYWTDITRTYCLGEPDDRQRAMYAAILAARSAALAAITPGVAAAEVDRAAREVLDEAGFGDYFTHGIGHNVGFSAISAEFPPRLHPASPDRLGVGMTFNIEPAMYIAGYGGIRHCDVVTLGPDGAELLTPFAPSLDDLVIPV